MNMTTDVKEYSKKKIKINPVPQLEVKWDLEIAGLRARSNFIFEWNGSQIYTVADPRGVLGICWYSKILE